MNVFIDSQEALDFLRSNRSHTESVPPSDSDRWIGSYILDGNDTVLAGVMGLNEMKSGIRIKSFYVAKDYRRRGIGDSMMKTAMRLFCGRFSAFATCRSLPIFLDFGFEKKWTNNNNITFVYKE